MILNDVVDFGSQRVKQTGAEYMLGSWDAEAVPDAGSGYEITNSIGLHDTSGCPEDRGVYSGVKEDVCLWARCGTALVRLVDYYPPNRICTDR